MDKYEVVKVKYGEHLKLLDEGYEPFAVVAFDTSYTFQNTSTNRRETEHQFTDFIYLRKLRTGA